MSAWLIGKRHVDALVCAFLEEGAGEIDTSHLSGRDQLGQLLMDACMRSVAHRYPDHSPGDLPGWKDDYRVPYRYAIPVPPPTPVETHKNCDCYIYQSSEHPAWKSSLAHELVTTLRRIVTAHLGITTAEILASPEWQDAPWGWGE